MTQKCVKEKDIIRSHNYIFLPGGMMMLYQSPMKTDHCRFHLHITSGQKGLMPSNWKTTMRSKPLWYWISIFTPLQVTVYLQAKKVPCMNNWETLFWMVFYICVWFISYSKCSNWHRLSKIVVELWMFIHFLLFLDRASSIKTDLHICKLWTGPSVNFKSVI